MEQEIIYKVLIDWLNSKGITYTNQLTEEELIELQRIKTKLDEYYNIALTIIVNNNRHNEAKIDFSTDYEKICQKIDTENKKFEEYRQYLNQKYQMSLH